MQLSKVVAVLLVSSLSAGGFAAPAFAQKAKPTNSGSSTTAPVTTTTNKTANNDPPATSAPPTFASKLPGILNASLDDRSDYVPCFFSKKQLLALQPAPALSMLSAADAETLRQNVMQEALSPENASGFTSGSSQQFAQEIGNTVFEGLTHSEANTRVLEILGKYTATTSPATAVSKSGMDAKTFVEHYALPTESAQRTLSNAITTDQTSPTLETALNQQGQKLFGTAQAATTKQNVANVAQADLAMTHRPQDIGCSMSILSYETTRKAFGETMAEEYIAVQIALRNINAEKEFLVQSAEVRVDSDINGRAGRYASGVDKLTAREYMLASREFGKRNLMINSVQASAEILSAVVPFTGPFVKQFSGVYSGALPGALAKIFPDHNTEQLTLLDDEGFSNSRTDRTVVPKSGTAEFVIFVSSKEFQQGWWTQDCAHAIRIAAVPKKDPKDQSKDMFKCIGKLNSGMPHPACFTTEDGVDLEAARETCIQQLAQAGTDSEKPTYFKPRAVSYRHWTPRSLAIFRELSMAVVAGTHISETADTTPSLTKIVCLVDTEGNVKLDAATAKDGVIVCALTGDNLDKVAQLKLRNFQDATDTKTAEGTVSTSGDPKSGKVSFPVAQLGALTASAYKVYTVTKDGVEGGGDLLLHLPSKIPTLAAVPDPATLDLATLQGAAATSATLKLKGYHLDHLSAVNLTAGSKMVSLTVPANAASPTDASVSIARSDLEKVADRDKQYTATDPLLLSLSLLTSSTATPITTGQTLAITGEIKSAPAAPAPTSVGKRPKQSTKPSS